MYQKMIKISSIADAEKLVKIASSKPYAITLESDRFIVNAKSIMGVLSLDLTQKLKLVAETDSTGELNLQLRPFSD